MADPGNKFILKTVDGVEDKVVAGVKTTAVHSSRNCRQTSVNCRPSGGFDGRLGRCSRRDMWYGSALDKANAYMRFRISAESLLMLVLSICRGPFVYVPYKPKKEDTVRTGIETVI